MRKLQSQIKKRLHSPSEKILQFTGLMDSGASSHISANEKYSITLEDPRNDTPRCVTFADSKRAVVKKNNWKMQKEAISGLEK